MPPASASASTKQTGFSRDRTNALAAATMEAPAPPTAGTNIRHVAEESVVIAGTFGTGSVPGAVITSVLAGDAGF